VTGKCGEDLYPALRATFPHRMGKGRRIDLTIMGLVLLTVLAVGCKQSTENNTTPSEVTAQLLEGSAYLPANVSAWYTYRILVSDNRYSPDSIVCEVRTPGGAMRTPFTLYDDGGAHALSGPDYASPTSGDIAAHDGQFTRQINSQLLSDSATGDYQFHFVFYGSTTYNMANDGMLAVSIQNAGPCLIASYPRDSVFEECFAPDTLVVKVSLSEADRVDTLRLTLFDGTSPMTEADFAPLSGDTVWSLSLTPAFFGCLPTADNAYHFEYTAHTVFGESCLQTGNVASFVNNPPTLSDPALPNSAYRGAAPGDSNVVVATVRLHDCELTGSTAFLGVGSNPGVKFDTHRAETDWGHGPNFFLRDDGVAPDEVPGDGVYSTWLVLSYSDTLLDNMYYFRFYAIDCATPSDTSAFVFDSVRVIQPAPGAPILQEDRKGPITGAVL
jgi:hypothetical protein